MLLFTQAKTCADNEKVKLSFAFLHTAWVRTMVMFSEGRDTAVYTECLVHRLKLAYLLLEYLDRKCSKSKDVKEYKKPSQLSALYLWKASASLLYLG